MPYQRILDLMCLREHPNLFLLGVYAKRVTLYSQQVRAINLVDAIRFYRQPLEGTTIAIIGAGGAGLTAAARALSYGATVTLFEQNSAVMSVQTNSRHRWLHPKVYEWPGVALGGKADDAELPIMDWSAQIANEMASNLKKQWEDVVEKNRPRVREVIPARVTAITPTNAGYQVTYLDHDGGHTRLASESFSLVILAVGFGLEPLGTGRNSYWEQDPLDQISRPGNKYVLIAGYGDGALTDLMRICLNDFDHASVLTDIVRAMSEKEVEEVDKFERSPDAADAATLTAWYSSHRFPKIAEILNNRRRKLAHVFLTGRGPYLFDPRASALNRLVVSQLLQLGAFKNVPMEMSEELEVGNASDPVVARIQNQVGVEFSDVILRFGPDPEISKIAGLPSTLQELKSQWDRMRPQDDVTRIPLWKKFKPISDDLENCCIAFWVADADGRESGLPLVAQNAVGRLLAQQNLGNIRIKGIPKAVKGVLVEDCVQNEESLTHTVRALCRAPVAIFALGGKMGQENPVGMFLLGIRAVVRRGLTLVVREGKSDPANWSALPFNLKELPLLSLEFDAEGAEELKDTIASGLAILDNEASGYRDLPVFEIVRRTARRIPEAKRDKLEVFVLCPFSDHYTKKTWRHLRLLVEGVDRVADGKLELKRVVDYSSPLLVGERLYELTRFAGLCVVDWSEWRANVFFEFGVRLAVKSSMPICVIKTGGRKLDKARKHLRDLFKPLLYSFDDKSKDGGVDFQTEFQVRVLSNPRTQNAVYNAAESNIVLGQEQGQVPYYEDVLHHVDAMLGSDLVTSGKIPILYGANRELARQIWRSAVEALTAARLLLLRKIELTKDPEAQAHLKFIQGLIHSKLLAILEHDLDPAYQSYGEDIPANE